MCDDDSRLLRQRECSDLEVCSRGNRNYRCVGHPQVLHSFSLEVGVDDLAHGAGAEAVEIQAFARLMASCGTRRIAVTYIANVWALLSSSSSEVVGTSGSKPPRGVLLAIEPRPRIVSPVITDAIFRRAVRNTYLSTSVTK